MRNVDARLKVTYLAAVLVLGLVANNPFFSATQVIIAVGLSVAARPTRLRVRILLFPLLFALIIFGVHTFLTPGTRTAATILEMQLYYSPVGFQQGTIIALRVIAGTLMFFWFAVSTEFPEIRGALAWLRVPEPVVSVLSMTWRYLSVYSEEVSRMRQARTLRLGFSGWRHSVTSVSAIGGQTVLRAFDHSERTYQAMRLRGFNGTVPVKQQEPITTATFYGAAWLWLLLGCMMLLLLIF